MKVLTAYIKQHKRTAAFYFIAMAVFFVLLFFYRLPPAAWAYGAVLCLFFGLVLAVPDYLRFRKKHRELRQMGEQQEITGAELLPVPYYTMWTHQVKTPIAALKLSLENEDSSLAREVRGEVVRIDQYVDMAMCYLRLDSETTDYVFEECEMDQIIRQAVRKFSSSFIQKKIRLEYEPMDWKAVTDEKWLLFVIEQVLSNSLKYTRPQGKVSIEREKEQILCIRDNGIGIAPEDIPRIFEKGYTGYNGRSDKKASGLGLYLCRRICDNLGYRIWASSSVGEGTAIYIDLEKRLTKM